jgi:predicted site-specific integrase-resolvase
MSDAELLRTPELATRLGVSQVTLARWRRLGTGPRFLKRSGIIFYRAEDVSEFETQRDRIRTSTREAN